MANPLQSLTDSVLGLLFPDRCVGCKQAGSMLCARCQATLRPYPATRQPLVLAAFGETPILDEVLVAYQYDGVLRAAIHTLKYDRIQRMAVPLGQLLAAYVKQYPVQVDALLPVPLHPKRLAARGFNQSALLAEQLGQLLRRPVVDGKLVRSRDTAQQVGLASQARFANVQQAFRWQSTTAAPPRVLLIDDVLTTGATLGACAQALRAAGSHQVQALVLARSGGQ